MKYVIIFLPIFVFCAYRATAAPSEPDQATGVSVVASPESLTSAESLAQVTHDLLNATASDFHTDSRDRPLRFRSVYLRIFKSPGGKSYYIMCGDYMPLQLAGPGYMQFATVNTARYGQSLGAHAADLCQRSSSLPRGNADLSASLQRVYDSLP